MFPNPIQLNSPIPCYVPLQIQEHAILQWLKILVTFTQTAIIIYARLHMAGHQTDRTVSNMCSIG